MTRNICSYVALATGLLVALATSTESKPRIFSVGTYRVNSDCPGAQTSGELTIKNPTPELVVDQYTLETGTSFGFPSNSLQAGQVKRYADGAVTESASTTRNCQALLWETAAQSGIFACYEGDNLVCTIHLEKI